MAWLEEEKLLAGSWERSELRVSPHYIDLRRAEEGGGEAIISRGSIASSNTPGGKSR